MLESVKPVASSEGVNIYCPEDGRFSFFNSSYPAHRSYAGIDVYPKRAFGEVAPSPIKGEVIKVKMVKCPRGKGFEGAIYDYVILFRSLNPERWIKILHVRPHVKVGDIVEPGEDLGILLRSGFFDFWTDPHIHVEVRKPSDPIRARGGLKFERLIEVDNEGAATKDLSGIVVESKPEYSLVTLNDEFKHGIAVDLDGQVGLLDAGIPHYGWFGVHMDTMPLSNGTIRLCGRKIGTVKSIHSNMCVAECYNLLFTLNNEPVDLSLYLYLSSTPLVKVIPRRPSGLTLKKLEEVSVVIS